MPKETNSSDKHQPTREENDISSDWVEKVDGNYKETLTCGDRVFYIGYQV